MTVSTPDQVAISAAHRRAGSAGQRLELVVDLHHLFDQRRRRLPPRVGGQETRGVGEQDQQVSPHEVGHQRAEPVVVAETDLLVGHRVVLVDHRHDAEVDEVVEGLAGVEVLLAVDEVEGGEEHLPGQQAVGLETLLPGPHQPVLADRRDGLQDARVGRAGARPIEGRPPHGDGTRGHEHDRVALRAQVGDLPGHAVDQLRVGMPVGAGDRGGAELDHHGAPAVTGGAHRVPPALTAPPRALTARPLRPGSARTPGVATASGGPAARPRADRTPRARRQCRCGTR
jgi:hypothetical protein